MDRLQLDIRKVSKTKLGGMEFRKSRHFAGKTAALMQPHGKTDASVRQSHRDVYILDLRPHDVITATASDEKYLSVELRARDKLTQTVPDVYV